MIRIRFIRNKISLIFFFLWISTPLHSQAIMGARSLALGSSTTVLKNNSWAMFSNPALISSEGKDIGFYGLRNFGFSEISDAAAFATIKTKIGINALAFHTYGDNTFKETSIRYGYENVWEQVHFGIVMHYNHISFGGSYGSGGALGVDIGMVAKLTEKFWIGAKSTNINQPQYDFVASKEDLPRNLSIGISYDLSKKALFVADIVKDVRFPVSYRSGIEVNVVENIQGRVGITTEPLTYSFGLGIERDYWEVNLAIQQHSLLGLSPGFDLQFSL